jgi:hypothetical protein
MPNNIKYGNNAKRVGPENLPRTTTMQGKLLMQAQFEFEFKFALEQGC